MKEVKTKTALQIIQEKRNQHFLTNENIPNELKVMVLEKFSFSELAKYYYAYPNKIGIDLIRQEFHRRREKDLSLLVKQIGCPFNKKAVWDIIRIRRTHQHDFSLIERSIIHLCHLDHRGAGEVLSDYLCQSNIVSCISKFPEVDHDIPWYERNQIYNLLDKQLKKDIVSSFFKYYPYIEIDQRQKTVQILNGADDNYEYKWSCTNQWSSLIGTIVLGNDASISRFIVNRYSRRIPEIIAGLDELWEKSAYFQAWSASVCEYTCDEITAAKKTLLLQLKPQHDKYYTLTHADKRLIENQLVEEINQLSTKNALHRFYCNHADALYLNQHRHAVYDAMRHKPFPQIKNKILSALQKRSSQIISDDIYIETGKRKEILDQAKFSLKSTLKSKRDGLLLQDRGMTFFLVYSVKRTNQKINIINQFLEKIDAITNLAELRMFTENLMLCNELTARRTFGLGVSDTYVKLKEFYQEYFVNTPVHRTMVLT